MSVSNSPGNQRLFQPLLILSLSLAVFLLSSCGVFGGGGGSDGESASQDSSEASNQQAASQSTPIPVPPTPTPVPEPTPTPAPPPPPTAIAHSPQEARNLVWVYLSQCISFDSNGLEAYLVNGDWYVTVATGDVSQEYGLWRVIADTGNIEPHDILAGKWQSFVNSQCDAELMMAIATPTTVPVPTDTPVPTPTPVPAPVVTEASNASVALWAHLVKCYPELSTEDIEARWNPAKGEWVTKTKSDATTDYGVWLVGQDGSVFPNNLEAVRRDTEVRSGEC